MVALFVVSLVEGPGPRYRASHRGLDVRGQLVGHRAFPRHEAREEGDLEGDPLIVRADLEEAESPTDLGVSVNTYLGNLSEWHKWDWMALRLSIELGLNTITYEEIKSRIPDDFVETA